MLCRATRRPKNDRLDARWLLVLLVRDMLPPAWLPPEEIQRLRDKTRLRKALADDHTRWAQRLHALLVYVGWPCSRGSPTVGGATSVAALCLDPSARTQVTIMLAVLAGTAEQIDMLDVELRRMAKSDERVKALQRMFGVGADPGRDDPGRDRRGITVRASPPSALRRRTGSGRPRLCR